MNILGISAFYHDSAAALISRRRDRRRRAGRALYALQEHQRLPAQTLFAGALKNSGLKGDQIDFVAFYDKPFLKFERLIETYLAFAPRGFTLVPHRDADLDQRKAVSEGFAAA